MLRRGKRNRKLIDISLQVRWDYEVHPLEVPARVAQREENNARTAFFLHLPLQDIQVRALQRKLSRYLF